MAFSACCFFLYAHTEKKKSKLYTVTILVPSSSPSFPSDYASQAMSPQLTPLKALVILCPHSWDSFKWCLWSELKPHYHSNVSLMVNCLPQWVQSCWKMEFHLGPWPQDTRRNMMAVTCTFQAPSCKAKC